MNARSLRQHRVNRQQPCPICRKTTGCLLYDTHTICLRVASDTPVQSGLGGWLHKHASEPSLLNAALQVFTQPSSRLGQNPRFRLPRTPQPADPQLGPPAPSPARAPPPPGGHPGPRLPQLGPGAPAASPPGRAAPRALLRPAPGRSRHPSARARPQPRPLHHFGRPLWSPDPGAQRRRPGRGPPNPH